MRNDTTEKCLEKDVNSKIKIEKNSPHKGSILCKIIDFGNEKFDEKKEEDKKLNGLQQRQLNKRNVLTSTFGRRNFETTKENGKESFNHYQKSFLYSEKVKQAEEEKSANINKTNSTRNKNEEKNNTKQVIASPANEKSKLIDTMRSNSSDSRVTGGGGKEDVGAEGILSKKPHRENSTTRRVSFKVRHPTAMHRKNPATEITVTTLTSSKVAALTQKFNDLIREKDSLLKEPKLAKVVDRIHSCRNKNTESNNSTPNSTLSSNVSVKILSNNKVLLARKASLKSKSASNSSLDKIAKLDSPNTHSKVIRVRSENTPKKKSSIKKKEVYKNMEFTHLEKNRSFRDIREKYNKVQESPDDSKITKNVVKRKPSIKNSSTRNSIDVQAAIKIFESQKKPESTLSDRKSIESKIKEIETTKCKPDVPIKKIHLINGKNVVVKDGVPKLKLSKSSSGTELNIPSKEISSHTQNRASTLSYSKVEKPLVEIANPEKKPTKQTLYYDKIKYRHKTVHPDKFQRTMSKTCDIDPNETPAEKEYHSSAENLNPVKSEILQDHNKHGDDSGVSLTDDEKLYNEVSTKIIPNESFLWRSNIRLNSVDSSEYENNLSDTYVTEATVPVVLPVDENEYDYVGPPVENSENKNLMEVIAEELDCPSFDTFIKRADELLITKKREIAEDLRKESRSCEPLAEAINLHVKNTDEDINNIAEAINIPVIVEVMRTEEEKLEKTYEGYESFESLKNDSDSRNSKFFKDQKVYSKRYGPLPQLPHESKANARQLTKLDDGVSIHSYEYCQTKIIPDKDQSLENDEGYEYCKSPRDVERKKAEKITALDSTEQKSISLRRGKYLYESIPTDKQHEESHYEIIPSRRRSEFSKSLPHDQTYGENYDECNCDENIYDTIKQSDSVSNCYESIPGSPHSVIRLRQKDCRKYDPRVLLLNKPFDSISNFSQVSSISTIISENKTNSIYGQRSILSFERSDITTVYGEAPSEISSSDRSDEWIDMSDQEESSEDPTIIIIREKVKKGRRSPASWSRKVRYQWNMSPKENVYVSSPSIIYITTSNTAPFYSDNDQVFCGRELYQNVDTMLRLMKEDTTQRSDFLGLAVMKLQTSENETTETQEVNLLIDTDSSDKEHFYESLSHTHNLPLNSDHHSATYYDDFDSFDSDSDTENRTQFQKNDVDIHNTQLPEPPTSSNIYTLTKFASAAGKKMRQLKSNFTKSTRKKSATDENKNLSLNEDKEPSKKSKKWSKENNKTSQYASQNTINTNTIDRNKSSNSNTPFYESTNSQYPVRNAVSNVNLTNSSQLNLELASALSDRKLKSDNSTESVNNTSGNNTSSEAPITPVTNNKTEKDSIILSRKYLSFKSKFKRNSSVVDPNSLSLSLTNSVFYLNDIDDSTLNKSDTQTSIESGKDDLNLSNKSSKNGSQDALPSTETSPVNGNTTKISPRNHRKSITSIKTVKTRPSAPPPPPPTENIQNGDKRPILKKDRRISSSSSWYAECGLFKASEPYRPESNGQVNERKSSSSWYSEVGLYQVGNISSSSSSGASCTSAGGTSTTTAPSPPPPLPPIGMFNQEPLYQFYNAAKLESVCREIAKDSDLESDGYEEIANFREGQQVDSKTYQRPSAMALIHPQKGPSRTLWCEIPEVINSRILDTMIMSRKKLQEAMFEIITSEASYLNSLTVLESQFMSHSALLDNTLMSESERKNLFGNVIPVKHCSEQLMADLEQCWQDNILLRGLCKIIYNHAEKNFHVYVKYCECQVFLIKALKKLKQDEKFNAALLQIQSKPECQGLSLHSFLMLPMQRITRLPLLLDAVLKNLEKSDDEYQDCLNALATLNTVVSQCNEGARRTERLEEMTNIAQKIEFPTHIKKIPILVPNSDKNSNKMHRWLVRSGELTQLVWRGDDQSKLTFGKKFTKISLHLFLFTDLLIVTKRKSEESYIVIDYCKRSLLELNSSSEMMLGQAPVKETAGKHVILLTMLENCENKTVEMLLSCVSESDRQRWTEACTPPPSDNPNETIYEGWDCPQVAAMYSYQTTQPDELNLQQGDIVNVTKKMADGWYHGERISDGEKGWFPGNYTVEIASQHVRAKNLRQRYRLLALTGSYLGQKKK